MAEIETVQENSSIVVVVPNNKNPDTNEKISDQNSQPKIETTSTSNNNFESIKPSNDIPRNHSTHNNSFNDMTNGMPRLSAYNMHPRYHPNSSRFRPQLNYSHRYPTSAVSYFPSQMHQLTTQAEIAAFTPPLMSLQFPEQQPSINQRNYYTPRPYTRHHSNKQTSSAIQNKSETTVSQPEYYVDNFAPNFSDKPSSSTNNDNNKSKTKHVTFLEPEKANELSTNVSNNVSFSPSLANNSVHSSSTWSSPVPPMHYPPYHLNQYPYHNQRYPYNPSYPQYPNMMMNQTYIDPHYNMNMMPTYPSWQPRLYDPTQQQSHVPYPFQQKQLYDPKKPKTSATSESHNTPKVIRSITPKNKKKTKQTNNNDDSIVSTSEPIPHPITILRKPSTDTEITTPSTSTENKPFFPSEEKEEEEVQQPTITPVEDHSNVPSENEQINIPSIDNQSESNTVISLTTHELLSILQSANCISTLNEYAQQKKFTINYEFSSISPSLFTCIISINNRQFPASSPCPSKIEAQKLACDQALRTLYRELSTNEQSLPDLSNIHDYIALRSLSKFQDLNVNELLLGRKTLACILMVTNGQFDQACVISIGTGNGCLAETNLVYADDGTALHDCHAEILARRGLIRYLFEQIKQSKDSKSSIFQYNSTINKYELHENITFHMYISSLPCGNASLELSTNSIRYKQGQKEGTILASTDTTIKYPIKSCSDKICRWNILGIQGGLLVNLLTKPIYLNTITLACETTFNRNQVKYSLCERLNEHCHLLPTPFVFHLPDIDCPKTKTFQQERQVAKLQTSAFAWNITQSDRNELLEPMTGKLKNDRSISSLSKQNLFKDFTNFIQTNDNSLSYTTYQQAKQLNKTYVKVKELISTAFQNVSSDINISWLSKSDQLEQFSIQ
ncbi:unnamed protein product [Adineta steineri]|uniref:Uncharacterized protein n=2 Tax=Adineta steineri TaxID=433720 RepID=A0A813MF85_9BILA|nr:unnamed protein product [Adineta steineri]CAF0835446.1 unnamed protein product [Adineta steineri]